MSGTTDAVVFAPAALVAPVVIAGVAVPVVIGSGVALAAVAMWHDYADARQAMAARLERERRERADRLQRWTARESESRQAASRTYVSTDIDAELHLLLHGLGRVEAGLQSQDPPPQDLLASCASLRERLLGGEPAGPLLPPYVALLQQAHAARRRTRAEVGCSEAEALRQALDEVEHEIHTGLTGSATRDVWLARWRQLESNADGQPQVVSQGLEVLRRGLHREVFQQAERRAAEAANALVAEEIGIRLRTVLRAVPDDPALLPSATAMLDRLAAADLSQPGALDVLERESAALFQEAATAVARAGLGQQVAHEVREVLMTLGYRVQLLPEPDTGVVARVGEQVGIEFDIGDDGRVQTEMVALADGVTADERQQEQVCQVVDQVFAGLRARSFEVREKVRRNRTRGERLRPATVPIAAGDAAAEEAAPQARRRDDV